MPWVWSLGSIPARSTQVGTPWVVSRSALGKQKVYYPRVSAEAEDVRYTIQGFRVLIKNDFEV